MCKFKVPLILFMIFVANVVRSSESDENFIVDAISTESALLNKIDEIENPISDSDSSTLTYNDETTELSESTLSGGYSDATESLDAILTADNSIADDTTTESITTESDTLATAESDFTSTESDTTTLTTTEIIETTTEDLDISNFNDVTSQSSVCRVVSTNYILNETNYLTVSWVTNGTLCTNNTIVNINLLDKSCLDNCVASNTPSHNCFTTCSKTRNSNQSPYSFFSPLEPCHTYTYSFMISGISSNQNTSFVAHSNYSYVENLNAEDIIVINNDNSSMLNISVTWSYNYTECDQEFVVEIMNERYNQKYYTKFYNYTIGNVTACSQYGIKVYPRVNGYDEESFGQNVTFNTRRVDPSPIRDFNVSFSSLGYAIDVRWTPPMYGDKCIDFYEISVESEFESLNMSTSDCCKELISVNYSCVNYNLTLKTFSNDPERTTTFPSTTSSIEALSNGNSKAEQKEIQHIRSDPRLLTTSEISPTQSSGQTDTELYLFIEVNTTRNKCEISKYAFQCNNSINGNGSYEESLVTNVIMRNLLPDTDYNCSAKVQNEAGWSDDAFSTLFKTREGKPNPPIIKDVIVATNNFTFSWDEPSEPKGRIQNYKIHIKFLQFLYFNPDYCPSSPNITEFPEIVEGTQRNFTFMNAEAFSKYSISIQAQNSENAGEWSEVYFLSTTQDLPGPVNNFSLIENKIDPNVEYNNTIVVNFLYPCNANGEITEFVIFLNHDNLSEIEVIPIPFNNTQTNFTHPLELTPDTQYRIWVASRDGQNTTSVVEFTLTPGIPDATKIADISRDVTVRNSAKHYADLSLSPNLFQSSVGSIERIALLINQLDCGAEMARARNVTEHDNIYEMPSYSEAMEHSCIPQYYADDIHNPKAANILRSRHNSNSSIYFGIGKVNCDYQKPCDGPLKAGTKYAVTFRLYTRSGFADSGFIVIHTDKEVPLLAIILSFLVIMLIVFSIGFYITYKKPRKSHSAGQFDRKDVPLQNFEMHYKEMISNDNEKIREEYNAIQFFSDGLDKTMIASRTNEKCNRYVNIAPFDYNRVMLDDEFENDYINASFVNGYYYAKEFIATQGPKPTTSIDFWRMVLQYKTESIVMLTSLVENNKVKCHEYFPKLNGHVSFDNIKIVCTSEQKYSSYVKRILEVEKDDIKLKVKHYYFCKWLDHSACNATDLIDFVKTVRLERDRPSETFIVHCSAGVGRTGTFIAVDILLQRIKQEKKVNIFDLVKQLRKQRMKMVQSFDQYLLIYNAALELSTTRAKQPKVMNSISMYIENIELFKNWRQRGNRGNNDCDMKVIDKNESPL